MRCSTCDYALPEDVTFCPNCGARVPAASAGLPTVNLPTTPAPPAYAPPAQPVYGQQPMGIPQGSLTGPPPAMMELPRSTAAVVSLVSGIVGLFVPFVGIIAIIAGHMALGEIKRAQGMMEGRGIAIAGLIMGYIELVLTLLGCVVLGLFVLFAVGSQAS
jgi:hypothetical protein